MKSVSQKKKRSISLPIGINMFQMMFVAEEMLHELYPPKINLMLYMRNVLRNALEKFLLAMFTIIRKPFPVLNKH